MLQNLYTKSRLLFGRDYTSFREGELAKLFLTNLLKGMHGICFSVYLEGQKPGDILGEDQIRRRMEIIAPYTKWVRSFSCVEGNELIPKIAKEYGLKTMVGAWIGKDPDLNATEIEGLLTLASAGYVDIAAVGNEVLFRDDLPADVLIDYILYVKKHIENIDVGYVDAYFKFMDYPDISAVCDVILANCYPYWEGYPVEHSLVYMQQMYEIAKRAGQGKKVIISETGWPSQGKPTKAAIPSKLAFMKYFIDAQEWSQADDIEMFYFASFDESWKIASEGDVGAYWGIWDHNGHLKV